MYKNECVEYHVWVSEDLDRNDPTYWLDLHENQEEVLKSEEGLEGLAKLLATDFFIVIGKHKRAHPKDNTSFTYRILNGCGDFNETDYIQSESSRGSKPVLFRALNHEEFRELNKKVYYFTEK